MNGYIGQMVVFTLIGLGVGYLFSRKVKEGGWQAKIFGVMLPCSLLGFLVGFFLCIVPLYISYNTMPLDRQTAELEKVPGHEYYIVAGEDDEYGRQSVKFRVNGQSREETGEVSYDLESGTTPYVEEITNRPGWLQHLYPPARDDERTFHVRPLSKDLSWFEGQKKAIEALDVQIEGLRQPNSLRGYAPATLISQAEEFNREQLQKLIVQRDILAMTYNKEASRLDKQGFNDQLSYRDGVSVEVDVPYQIKVLGKY